MQRMDELLYREEMMWFQRSRISWLCEGDRNTKYFHRKAATGARRNRIKRLIKDDGQATSHREQSRDGENGHKFLQNHVYCR
jgi:hypothetical protein